MGHRFPDVAPIAGGFLINVQGDENQAKPKPEESSMIGSRLRSSVRLSVALAVMAVLISPPALRAQTGLTVVTIGTLSSDNSAAVYYAQELGIFKKYGIDAQISAYASGPVTAAAVTGGAIDVGVANVASIAVARTRGVPLKFLFPASIAGTGTLTDQIAVAKDSTAIKAADLNGKTIGVNGLRDLQQLCAMSWVDKHGGDSKTLHFIEVPIPQMGTALSLHRIDAGMPVEPFVTAQKDLIRSLGSVLDGVGPHYMVIGYLASDTWLSTHAEVAARFVRAMREASVWGNTHRAESAAMIERIMHVDPSVGATMNRATYGTDLDPALMQPVLDAALKYGILERPVPTSDLIWRAPR
jgi:NitT/TauT family transport system substrate-binding protein